MSFDPLHTVKRAAEQASQAARDVREQAATNVGSLKELVVGKIVDVKESVVSGVKELIDDLNQHLPALQEAGYALSEVSVEAGLGAKVVATFTTRPDISPERVDAVIAEHRDAKVTVALLRALFAAYKMQSSLHVGGLKPRGIAIELGIAPAIVVKFA